VPAQVNSASSPAASDTLNAGMRNSRRSISGSGSVRWRSTKATPTTSPATMNSTGGAAKPSSAIRFSP
jgi:hypothetical protein